MDFPAAAYSATTRLIDERLGLVHNFATKEGVEHCEILALENAPSWVSDRERLWNEVERAEKRCDAQVAREVRIALPKELKAEQQVELIRAYINDQFVAHGMVADLAIHRDNPENPHAHILLTLREIGPEGFGKKCRDWNRVETLEGWRQEWSRACNLALIRAGSKSRITHLSHAVRGLLTLPGIKIGIRNLKVAAERRGFVWDRVARQEARRFRNGELIRKDPRAALQELTYHEAVFTRDDVRRYLQGRTTEGEQAEACFDAIMAHTEVVFAGVNERRVEVFTTTNVLENEQAMLAAARKLDEAKETTPAPSAEHLARFGEKLGLTEEQAAALTHVVRESGKLAVVEGFAGTGKSRMFDGARVAWQKQGKRVLGAALAGKAAEELSRSARLNEARSLAAWEYAWSKGKDRLGKHDVLVIDEAGMVGTRQMRRVLEHALDAGAKVVLAGDCEQLQAVEAGSPFHAIGELVEKKAELSTVRRQREEWQRQASQFLAKGLTEAGITAYAQRGFVHDGFKEDVDAVAALLDAWKEAEKTNKGVQQVALSYRRAHIPELNLALRAVRQELGAVKGNWGLCTDNGVKKFGLGDRLCFTKNSRAMGVRNGTLGTVMSVGLDKVVVRLDGADQRSVEFENSKWTHIDYGYAMSVHRSQGITVDRTHVVASRAFDRHAAYVAMTRHRDRLDIYASHEVFPRVGMMSKMFARKRHKRLALDHMAAHLVTQMAETERREKEAAQAARAPEKGAARGYALARRGLEAAQQAEKAHTNAKRTPKGMAVYAARAGAAGTKVGPVAKHGAALAGVAVGAHQLSVARKLRAEVRTARAEVTAAGREMGAARELRAAEQVAAGKKLSLSAARNVIEETAAARKALKEAAEVRTFWRAEAEKAQTSKSLLGRVGFGRQQLVRDPMSGEPMIPAEGLRAAARRVKVAAEDLEHLFRSPAVEMAARQFASKHNRPIEEARARLDELRAHYEDAKAAARVDTKSRAAATTEKQREREVAEPER